MNLLTDEYRALNASLHQANPNYGTSGYKWAEILVQCLEEAGAQNCLDYGCGKQTLSQSLPHLGITGYDPCIEGLDDPPIAHDFVMCGDVLEHVEEEFIDAVLDHIQHLAIKGVLLIVNQVPSDKHLSDGRTAHILQRPPEWWMPKIMERWCVQLYKQLWGRNKAMVKRGGPKVPAEFLVYGIAK